MEILERKICERQKEKNGIYIKEEEKENGKKKKKMLFRKKMTNERKIHKDLYTNKLNKKNVVLFL